MLTLTQEDYLRLVKFMRTNYGINLERKKELIQSRLSDIIASMGYTSFKDYVKHIETSKDQNEIEIIVNALTTNYTYFMRENTHFDHFRDVILPDLEKKKKDKVLSIWSAGCSSGEEPYTLSMLIMDHFGEKAKQWDTRILATDISEKALQKALIGKYKEESISKVPESWKTKYFGKPDKLGDCQVSDQIRANVIYKTFNLMDRIQFKLKFDVIFCRNVMIYFDRDTQKALTKRFYDATNSGGYLFIGHSENLVDNEMGYNYIMPAAYRKN